MIIYNTMPNLPLDKGYYHTFFDEQSLGEWRKIGEVRENPYDHDMTEEEILREAKDADILLCGWGQTALTEKMLENMPNLKLIAFTGGSPSGLLANVKINERGIRIITGNTLYGDAVAEGCLCYTLSSLHEFEKYLGEVREYGWRKSEWKNKGLFGKKVGLVGFGAIAKSFAKMLKPFKVTPLVYSSYLTDEEAAKHGVKVAGLEEIFTQCDIISIHSAQTPKTMGMINRDLIYKMKHGSLFVNTARGGIVDQDALVERCEKGEIYAALDVYCHEIEYERGEIENPFKNLKNVVPMPHMAGATDFRQYVVCELARDAVKFLNGEPMENEVAAEELARMSR